MPFGVKTVKWSSCWYLGTMQGGFIAKPQQWVNEQRPFLLAVEDPQDPGRDIAAGSYEVRKVALPTHACGSIMISARMLYVAWVSQRMQRLGYMYALITWLGFGFAELSLQASG